MVVKLTGVVGEKAWKGERWRERRAPEGEGEAGKVGVSEWEMEEESPVGHGWQHWVVAVDEETRWEKWMKKRRRMFVP